MKTRTKKQPPRQPLVQISHVLSLWFGTSVPQLCTKCNTHNTRWASKGVCICCGGRVVLK